MVLLTGATGYIGGRLLTRLESSRDKVRCLARNPQRLAARASERVEVVEGDVLDQHSLRRAMDGVRVAYYLVHSMGEGEDFTEMDRRAAHNFAVAARAEGVERIVYVGGLGDENEELSDHLKSRHETGRILRSTGVPVIELRASIVIGSGSLSFELVRALAERLPAMVCPRWVEVEAQPIAIEDLLDYLVEAKDLAVEGSRVYEVGGPEVATYGEVMREYMRQRGLKRLMVPVPFLTPYLSSLWLGLVTPVYARIGRKLVQSLRHPTIVNDGSALTDFSVRPRGVADSVRRALANEDREYAETRWSDALSSGGQRTPEFPQGGPRVVDSRTVDVSCPPHAAFVPIQRIGGSNGWYFGDGLWSLRGFLDLLVGGVGTRRGRRHPTDVRVGDAIDFWRVESFEPGRTLRLRAEMKLPGRAWLQFEVEPTESGSTIRQTAIFDPVGVSGALYWYALFPLHTLMFQGMLSRIAKAAEAGSESAAEGAYTER